MRLCILVTVGCGKMDRTGFISDYASAYCDWEESCGNDLRYLRQLPRRA